MSTTHGLEQKIADKTAMIGVIGLGYVGLPLIRAFTRAGFRTMGFDVDQSKVEKLKAGKSYIKHIDSGAIAALINAEKFEPTADMERLCEADCIIICVPTPLNESRDPRLELYRRDGAFDRQDVAKRPTGGPGKHNAPHDHS